jgi:hypothetical protein
MLGRALAPAIDGGFIDGDDYSDQERPWYCSSLRTNVAVVQAGISVLENKPAVIIAYPLRCVNWIYYRRKFAEADVRTLFISLRASAAAIVAAGRGRRFDDEERERIREMIAEGYDTRPFTDLIFDTDQSGYADTLARLVSETQQLILERESKGHSGNEG